MDQARKLIELAALGIEIMAVSVIVIAIVHATVLFLLRVRDQLGNAYDLYKRQLGKALLLGLELLVAADIVRTVALDPTLGNVLILGLLVIIRTFLSWSLVVEIEERWPWSKRAESPGQESRGEGIPSSRESTT